MAGAEPVAGQIVQRRAGPAQWLDHVQLVRPRAVVELLVLLLEVIGQLDRQQEFHADARVAEELVVQQRPDQGAHLAGVALDLLRLVDPIDQDDDPRVAQGVQDPLELPQQFIAFLGTTPGGGRQRLAAQLGWFEPEQLPAQGGGVAIEHPQSLADVARKPLGAGQPPAPVDPTGQDRDQQPGENAQLQQGRDHHDQADDQEGCSDADLQVAAGPERPEARPASQAAPAPGNRLARRGIVQSRQQQQVAALVQAQGREADLLHRQQVDQPGHAQREDRVHVVGEPPLRQDLVHVRCADRCPTVVQIRVEIVIRNDEHPFVRVVLIVRLQLGAGLEPQGGLAAAFLAEDQRRRRIDRAAEELVPGRVVDRRQASPFEDGVRLRILLAERIADDPVMLEELFQLHPWQRLS
jgi:hypothetical protein